MLRRTCCLALFLCIAACGQAIAVDLVPEDDRAQWSCLKDAVTGKILSNSFSGIDAIPAAPDASIVPAPDPNGKWGYVDAATGKVLIAPQFHTAGFFYNGLAIVSRAWPERAVRGELRDSTGGVRRVVSVPVAQGLIDRKGREILPARYRVLPSVRWHGPYIPRLFVLEDENGAKAVFHADKGFIVPPGQYGTIKFSPEGGAFCDGVWYGPDGRRASPPDGCEIVYQYPETGMLRVVARKKEESTQETLEGLMRRDGSLFAPVKYYSIKYVPAAKVWLACGGDWSRGRLSVDVYDASGAILRSFRPDRCPHTVSGENCIYRVGESDYMVNARTGEPVPEHEEPADSASGFQSFREGGRYGIRNAAGSVSVRPAYAALFSLGGGLFAATRKKEFYLDNWGVIDGNGREIIPFIYGGIANAGYPTPATGPLRCMRFSPNENYWLLDREGRFITPEDSPYGGAIYFNAAGLAKVWRRRQQRVGLQYRHVGMQGAGVIDYTGKEVLPCKYDSVTDELRLREGKSGKEADPEESASGGEAGNAAKTSRPETKDALFRVERDKQWGLYDGTGKELIPIQYGYISELDHSGGLDPAQPWVGVQDKSREKHGVVNFRTGQSIAPKYDSVSVYSKFFIASLRQGYNYTYIRLNRQGKETARFENALWLSNAGVLAVKRGDLYALLDQTGQQISPFRYDDVQRAAASFLWCRTGVDLVLVDGKGREYRIRDGR
jgi:hypothetical protein